MYRTKRFDSLFLGPADSDQGLLFTGSSSRGHGNERWQESQHDSVRVLPILSRADRSTAFAHHEARSASTLAELERRRPVLESPNAALSPSPQPGPSTHRVFRSPQVDDNRFRVPGNVTHQHDRPPSTSPWADICPDDIRSNSSNGFSFNPATPLASGPLYAEPPHASGSQGPIVNPAASPRAHAHGRKGKRRANVQSPDAYIDSFDWSEVEIRRSVPSPQTRMTEIADSLAPPGLLLRSSSPCSHISVTSSNETVSVFSFEVNISAVEMPGSPRRRSAHVASSPPTPQIAVSPLAVSSLVENAVPDLSMQNQEGLIGEDNEDDSQGLQVSSGDATDARFGDHLSPAGVEHMDSSRADLSVLFDDSPTLIRLQSPSKVASTSRASTHLPTQGIRPSGLDTTSPPRVWPLWSPSLPPCVDEASRSTEVTGLGLSIEGVVSPHSQPLQHSDHMTTRAPLRIMPHRHAGSIDCQSPTGDDAFPGDAPSPAPPAQELPSYLRSAMSNLIQQQSGGTRSTNDAAPLNSPSHIPLPSSPTTTSTSTPSGSPTRLRLQAQPSHRSSPYMPFYPSLTADREDDQQPQRQHTFLSPSGLDVPLGFASGFGRPTPHPSPIRAPAPTPGPAPAAVIRTPPPSADPRSPISRLTQLRGSIVGLSRLDRVSFL